jgi:hypothetical protein
MGDPVTRSIHRAVKAKAYDAGGICLARDDAVEQTRARLLEQADCLAGVLAARTAVGSHRHRLEYGRQDRHRDVDRIDRRALAGQLHRRRPKPDANESQLRRCRGNADAIAAALVRNVAAERASAVVEQRDDGAGDRLPRYTLAHGAANLLCGRGSEPRQTSE